MSSTLMLQISESCFRSATAWSISFGSSVLTSRCPLRRRAIAIVSRGSVSRAVLPLYALASQKMSHGWGMEAMSSVTLSVRHAIPVAEVGRDVRGVGLDAAGREAPDSGGDVLEGSVVDVDLVLLAEVLEELLVEVVGVVEDRKGPAGLRLEPRRDRVFPEGHGDALVGPRKGEPAGAERLSALAGRRSFGCR